MKYIIHAHWIVEVETEEEAKQVLANIEDAAARSGCELDDSDVEEYD